MEMMNHHREDETCRRVRAKSLEIDSGGSIVHAIDSHLRRGRTGYAASASAAPLNDISATLSGGGV
jgi:hypothetical protein